MKGDNVLVIATVPGDTVLEKDPVSGFESRACWIKTIAEMLGPAAKWRLVEGTGQSRCDRRATATRPKRDDEVTQDPTVQAVLDLFGGQIESIEHRSNSSDQ